MAGWLRRFLKDADNDYKTIKSIMDELGMSKNKLYINTEGTEQSKYHIMIFDFQSH